MMHYLRAILCMVGALVVCSVPARAQIYVPPPMSDMGAPVASSPVPPPMVAPNVGNDVPRVGVFARHVDHVNPSVSQVVDGPGEQVNENVGVGGFTTDKVVRPMILGGKNPLVTLNNHPLPQGIDVAGVGHEAPGVIMTKGTDPRTGGPIQIIAPKGNKGVVIGGNTINFDGMSDTFNGSSNGFNGPTDSLGD